MVALLIDYDSSTSTKYSTEKVAEVKHFASRNSLTMSSGHKVTRFPLHSVSCSASLPSKKYTRAYSRLYKESPWIVDFYASSDKLNNVKALLPYYQHINQMLVNKKYESCNTFLRYVDVGNLSDVLLVGLLRLTYSWAEELSQWDVLFCNCAKEIQHRGKDPQVLLKGLINKNGNPLPI
ncbi:hypothetical protein [Neptunomonas marina]|uniref:Uncharacterized protein n=1 Tax=Neptunomonas marina TaxID=1815562 RepID=A0A437Q6S9_9GAMM|nr:hypothetical protein [Neptunomonas marina]RVU30232.1 hypothetical protein EOE65_11300 [Neptunomonas marina]